MEHRDPYSLFGVPQDATEDEIRDAYRRLVRVVHPDRFDKVKQPREWADANQFLKRINAAYAILTDPKRRAELDRELQGGEADRRTGANTRQSQPPTEESPRETARAPGHGHARFATLPEQLRIRLLERQQGSIKEQAWATTDHLSGHILVVGFFALWLPLLVLLAQDERWSNETRWWMLAVTVADGLLLGWFLETVIKFLRGPLKPRLYVTPLHLIETEFQQVRWWPIWTIKDLKATHHYRNGAYQHTAIAIAFADSTATFQLSPQNAADGVLRALGTYEATLRKAVAEADWDYFPRYDDFQGIASSPSSVGGSYRGTGLVAGSTVALTVFGLTAAWNSTLPVGSGPPPVTRQLPTPTERNADLRTPPRTSRSEPAFSAPPMALPRNGALDRFDSREAVAPLEIRTRGSDHHYFIKLVDHITEAPIFTVFVRGNQTVNVEVPLGSMKLRYAVGSTWYGERFLSGPETTYAEADARFDFTAEGQQIRGYTVELFLQPDGNLRERRIRPDQW